METIKPQYLPDGRGRKQGLRNHLGDSFEPTLLSGILSSTDGHELVATINVGNVAEERARSEKHWSRVEMGKSVTEKTESHIN